MLTIFMRALILYLVVVISMRMMGKRQIRQMQPYEIVITLLVADVVAATDARSRHFLGGGNHSHDCIVYLP